MPGVWTKADNNYHTEEELDNGLNGHLEGVLHE